MRRLLRFSLTISSVLLLVVVIIASLYFHIQQNLFRRRTERLLIDVRGLELRKAQSAEAQRIAYKWKFKQDSQECTDQRCDYSLSQESPTVRLAEGFLSMGVSAGTR